MCIINYKYYRVQPEEEAYRGPHPVPGPGQQEAVLQVAAETLGRAEPRQQEDLRHRPRQLHLHHQVTRAEDILVLQTVNWRSCTIMEKAYTIEIGTLTQRPYGMGGLVSIVSYSLSLMIIASRTQFHVDVERPWGQCPCSIVS